VIFKQAASQAANSSVAAALRHEELILQRLGEDAQICAMDGMPVLVRADKGGIPLRTRLENAASFDIIEGLRIACSICEDLSRIHARGILHKDINPGNILWDESTGKAHIIDFGISTELSQEAIPIAPPRSLEGTWAYLSPEQTGRMCFTIDRRTDFYSLGATLYEVFTGRPPFESTDISELVHAHLAAEPRPPSHVRPEVPAMVSAILLKLLAKEPESRYERAEGLLADFERCLRSLNEDGRIAEFALGDFDTRELFQISQRFYGRGPELEVMLSAFAEAAGGKSRSLFIAGYSGVGKSALVHQIQKAVVKRDAYFLSGKFDQLHRNVPYATMVQAFKGLIRGLLKESDEQLRPLRAALQECLGANGQVMLDVIPDLELIIGPQPPVEELPPAEAHNRFHRVLRSFIQVFATARHPLVFFLDDLQWTDSATLEMLERMAAHDEFTHLFVIGAYRDNEVGETHAFARMLERLRNCGERVQQIKLGPFNLAQTTELLADTLHRSPEDLEPLASLCMDKTAGNPFFLNQFLRSLYEQGLIQFEPANRRWEWALELIQKQHVTDNVIDLLVQRINELPPETREVLQLASCIGNTFDLQMLSGIAHAPLAETMSFLWSALRLNLVVPLDSDYRYAGLDTSSGGRKHGQSRMRFLHDRVQQASYSLIADEKKSGVHLQIARRIADLKADDLLFETLNHYNIARALVTDPAERQKLAEMNLRAARRAKVSAAYGPAAEYAATALELLGSDCWERDYPIAFEVHVEATEAAYLSHDYEAMEARAAVALPKARSPLDAARIEEVRIQALMARNEPVAAIHLALPVLRSLGVRLPERPTFLHVMAGLAKTKWLLRGWATEDLLQLPQMSDREKLATVRIMEHLYSSAYFAMPLLYPLIMFELIRLALKYGNAAATANGYAAYGVILCGLLQQIDDGYRFGILALDLVDRLAARKQKAKVVQLALGFVLVWKDHPSTLLDRFLEGHETGLDTGDFEFASYTCHMHGFFRLWMSEPLRSVDAGMRKYTRVIEDLKQVTPLHQQKLWRQLVANLLGKSKNPLRMIGEHYDETTMVEKHREANDAVALFFLQHCKLTLGLFFDDDSTALAAIEAGGRLQRQGVAMGSTVVPIFFGFATVATLRAASRASGPRRARLARQARRLTKQLEKWARCAPSHAAHRLHLVRAEWAAFRGDKGSAMECFQIALKEARDRHSQMDAAFVCERMSEFFAAVQQPEVAALYLNEAHYEYQRWEADGVLQRLTRKHPMLTALASRKTDAAEAHAEALARLAHASTFHGSSFSAGGAMLDLVSVIKATHTLSGEIILEDLLRKMIRIMIENAGADRGVLLLAKGDALFIEAEAHVGDANIPVLHSIPMARSGDARNGSPLVPAEIINYAIHTREIVVLDDAARIGEFIGDPYMAFRQPRSVICIPLILRGRVSGALYLENSLARGAFSPERASVLQVLSSEAAISIENARLYSNLEALNRSYARFVPHEFLEILGKRSILDVNLGDQIQGSMSVLFSDIMGFTPRSESLSPSDNFAFVNRFLNHMEPAFQKHGGFINQYIGDAIMGIFPHSANDAVSAGINMLENLERLNRELLETGDAPVRIGIGINTGGLMAGIVGGQRRLDTAVISDTVNTASRVESLTRFYRVPLLITDSTYLQIDRARFSNCIRRIDCVTPKGKSTPIDVYEVFAADSQSLRRAKLDSMSSFEEAVALFAAGQRARASQLFRGMVEHNPDDHAAAAYLERCSGEEPDQSGQSET
jgi:predicted ATPase/class 3 adenylate cyclase